MKAVLAALAAIVYTTSGSVVDCSRGKSLFSITSLSFQPDPVVRGQNSTLMVSMKVPEEINGGTATYSTSYNYIPFSPTVDPLCGTTVACPIAVGTFDVRSSYPVDSSLSGSLTVKIEWKDMNGRQLLCVSLSLKVGDAAKQLAPVKAIAYQHVRKHTKPAF